jgi:hypothetical protein
LEANHDAPRSVVCRLRARVASIHSSSVSLG